MTAVANGTLAGVVAESAKMRELLALVLRLAETRSPVLVEGESGTGKDLVAYWLHYGGGRREGPFLKVHCPSIPAELLESELFGHERGAFTDARAAKLGKIEMASAGTLYFDQILDLTPALQAKLLRVVEEQSFERLGGTRTLEVDVRFVASSSLELAQAVRDGRFREDLYHRLNVVTLKLPPLRERREDIPLLAHHFLRRFAARNAKSLVGFTDETMDLLEGYAWPGNVRELENVIERAVVLTRSNMISPADLPEAFLGSEQAIRHLVVPVGTPLEEVEDRLIEETLRYTKGDKTLAAKLLGIATRTIYRRVKGESVPSPTDSPAERPSTASPADDSR